MHRREIRRTAGPWLAAPVIALLGGAWLQAGAGAALQAPRQDQQRATPTFRVTASYVEVDVIVTDRDGNFIADLKPGEIQLREDTVPQKIATFELIDIPWAPTRLLWPDTAAQPLESIVEPDVESNVGGFNGRVYLIVLDDLHIHPAQTTRARDLARRFVERAMGPNDMAAVVATSGRQYTAQEYTRSQRALLGAIDRVVGSKVDSPSIVALGDSRVGKKDPRSTDPTEVLEPVEVKAGPVTEAPDSERVQRMQQIRASVNTLTTVAAHAASIRGRRKAIVLIGEGMEIGLADSSGTPREVRELVRQMLDTANRANVSIYALDPRGVTQGGELAVDIVGIDQINQNAWQTSGQSLRQDEVKVAKEGLQVFAENTGGYAFVDQSTMKEAFDRIRRENSTYYLLSYSPTNDRREGRFRTIDVKVSRPGAVVRARKGYIEADSRKAVPAPAIVDSLVGPSRQLREALVSPLPAPGVTITATAAPFRGVGAKASVLVLTHLSGQTLSFIPDGDKLNGSVEFALVAVDSQGRGRGGDHLDVTLPLSPAVQATVAKAGMMIESRLELPPGRYQLRVGARDQQSDRVGTVRYDLEVPDFSATPFALSGLILTSRLAGGVPTPRPDGAAKSLLGSTPITTRVFLPSDELVVAAEVYDSRTPAGDVAMATRVRTEGGRVVLKDEQHIAGGGTGAGASSFVVQVPLSRLDPGTYVLTVEARPVGGDVAPAGRDLRFTVWGGPR